MNRRDIELLSSYIDGQLKPSEAARLEARLSTDRELRTVLDDLRSTRSLLRQLPARKAPRNFTLTPKMVGKNPPLPRTYSAFRFVTTLASVLLFFTLGVNYLVPQMASQPPAFGMGGGGDPEVFSAQAPETAESAVEEAPAAEPPAELLPLPDPTFSLEETALPEEAPAEREGVTGDSNGQDSSTVQNAAAERQDIAPPIPPAWQVLLAGVAVLGALVMLMMRRLAAERWRQR